jgi:hypothetical protein
LDAEPKTGRISREQSEWSDSEMTKKYKIYVDDNYHHGDEGERYAVESYDSLEKAIEKCKEITIKSLQELCEEGISPEKLSAQWSMFGEDPYIYTGKGTVPFSARKFVSIELCKAIIELRTIET